MFRDPGHISRVRADPVSLALFAPAAYTRILSPWRWVLVGRVLRGASEDVGRRTSNVERRFARLSRATQFKPLAPEHLEQVQALLEPMLPRERFQVGGVPGWSELVSVNP